MKLRHRVLTAATLGLLAVVSMLSASATPAAATVGGTVTPMQNYPYFASLYLTDSVEALPFCGASIIAPDWALTAAHCVTDAPPNPTFRISSCSPQSGCHNRHPSQVIVHPLWEVDDFSGHDLALFHLIPANWPAVDTVQVGAPWDTGAYAPGTPAMIMGTGKTSANAKLDGKFRVAGTKLNSDDQMDSIFNPTGVLDHWNEPMAIGAGTPKLNSCFGDSGSPLIVQRNGRAVQVGVASFIYLSPFDDGCDNPSGYAELSGPQLAWIASVVRPVALGWRGCPFAGTVGQPVVQYTQSYISGAAMDGPYFWSIGCAPQQPSFQVAYRNTDGLLWDATGWDEIRRASNGLGIAPGTTPVSALLPDGSQVVAFHAWGLDTLWYIDTKNVGHDTGIKMPPGSSPAITVMPDPFAPPAVQVFFVNAADGKLWQLPLGGAPEQVGNGLAVSNGTSPDAIALPRTKDIQVFFNAAGTGTLWTADPRRKAAFDTEVAMAAGASPTAAALPTGDAEVAFGGGLLRLVTVRGAGVEAHAVPGLWVADGTRPAIAAQPSGDFQVAVNAGAGSGDTLWTVNAARTPSKTGGFFQPGTSPAILALPNGGYEIAYVAAVTNHLWLTDADHGGRDTGYTVTGQSSPSIIPARVGYIAGWANKCLDVAWASPANGTTVQLFSCNDTNAQHWILGPDATVRALGKCLDVAGGGTANGTRVQIWDCNNTSAQVWQLTAGNQLRNPQSDKCLDVIGASTNDWTPLQIWPCTGGGNQNWFPAISTVTDLQTTPTNAPPNTAIVPNLIRDTADQATADAQAAGVGLNLTSAPDTTCTFIGKVMNQNPPAGVLVPPGTVVTATIGDPPTTECP